MNDECNIVDIQYVHISDLRLELLEHLNKSLKTCSTLGRNLIGPLFAIPPKNALAHGHTGRHCFAFDSNTSTNRVHVPEMG